MFWGVVQLVASHWKSIAVTAGASTTTVSGTAVLDVSSASEGVLAACAEIRTLAREKLTEAVGWASGALF